jgi:hypothetical protein
VRNEEIGVDKGVMVILFFLSTMRNCFIKSYTKTVLAPLLKLFLEPKSRKATSPVKWSYTKLPLIRGFGDGEENAPTSVTYDEMVCDLIVLNFYSLLIKQLFDLFLSRSSFFQHLKYFFAA